MVLFFFLFENPGQTQFVRSLKTTHKPARKTRKKNHKLTPDDPNFDPGK